MRTRAWAAREGHELRIVFDGAAPEEAPDLVSSPYADDEIVLVCTSARGEVWLVTSDRALRERVGAAPARVIGGGTFLRGL